MSGAIPPLPQYAFMAWCSVKAQGQLLPFTEDLADFVNAFSLLSVLKCYQIECFHQ
jgi:hypothetical protein